MSAEAYPRLAHWKAVVFDLDGTLVDTRPGIRAALSAALSEVTGDTSKLHLADLSAPLSALISSVVTVESRSSVHMELAAAYRRHYDSTCWSMASTYPGVEDCLRDLASAGIRSFVVTNKRTNIAKRLLEHLGLISHFEDIVGQVESGDPLTKTVLLKSCLRSANLDPPTTIVVGDSEHDAVMAEECHLALILVTYGFGRIGDALADAATFTASTLAEVSRLIAQPLGGGKYES